MTVTAENLTKDHRIAMLEVQCDTYRKGIEAIKVQLELAVGQLAPLMESPEFRGLLAGTHKIVPVEDTEEPTI